MQILTTILYVVLFLVFLSILIVIHELGHLIAAKAFNVYCLEYSIGMGPLLFKYKRKNGETQFSLRGIPFGGYVSMYGEGVELPEGVEVPESRSLNGIKAWKRAIILLAGVTMNAVLAFIFLLASNSFRNVFYLGSIHVAESSVAAEANIPDGMIFLNEPLIYFDEAINANREFDVFDRKATINGDESVYYAATFNYDDLDSVKKDDYAYHLYIYPLTEDDKVDFANLVKPETVNYVDIHFQSITEDENGKYVNGPVFSIRVNQKEGAYESFGCKIYYGRAYKDFGSTIKGTFKDYGRCSVMLFQAIGDLFTKKEAWENVGGIVAVGFQTTSALQNFGFAHFLYYWGFISINLAIFNLIPFPGLDGWQLLVLLVEVIFRRKIPEKVKNIISLIGILLLLLLMVFVVVKDLRQFVFTGLSLL